MNKGSAMSSSRTVFRPLAATLSVLALAGAGAAHAQDENPSGPYISAGFGQFDVKIDNLDAAGDTLRDLDSDDAAWKVGFGWRFAPFFALEADYVDLGTPRGNFDATGSSGQYEVDLAGFSTYAIGTLPLGIFELSAKIGYYFHDIDLHVDFDNVGAGNGDVFDSDESGEAFVYGVGAGVTFIQHLNVQIEYELMDIDEVDDAYVLWLTGAWRF
jgi:hypothetical protein